MSIEYRTANRRIKMYEAVGTGEDLAGRLKLTLNYWGKDRPKSHLIDTLIVWNPYRRQGIATHLLERVIMDYGNKATLYLTASPYQEKPMDLDQLVAFYNKFGFECYGNRTDGARDMKRPKGYKPLDEETKLKIIPAWLH